MQWPNCKNQIIGGIEFTIIEGGKNIGQGNVTKDNYNKKRFG